MARSSRRSKGAIARLISRLQRVHAYAEKNQLPVDEVYDMAIEQEKLLFERRQFLKSLGAGVASTTALSSLSSVAAAQSGTDPGRVAIIGGGLAGLRCAHSLWQDGFSSKIFEASTRVGGRAMTSYGKFNQASIVERGGELVSTEHRPLRRLCRRLGLALDDVNGGANFIGEELYWSQGELVSEASLNQVWAEFRRSFRRAQRAAPWQPQFDDHNDEHIRLDNLDVPSWLDEIGLGANSPVGGIFQADVISEYGLAPEEQPALNLIYLLAWNPASSALPLAGTDEQYHIKGGSEALADAMLAELPSGTLELDKVLTAITGSAQGPYTLTFGDGSTYVADQLVLSLPFSKLREVDIAPEIWASFIPEKQLAIHELAMGDNAKLHIECDSRPWQQTREVNGELIETNGVSYSDAEGFVTAWDTQVAYPDAPGTVYCDYLGGHQGRALRGKKAFSRGRRKDVDDFIAQIENVFPGTEAAYTGKSLKSQWSKHEWSLGSYAAPALGHYTSFWGAQWRSEVENNIFFAGEHCSVESWGFMNGAIETGEQAAYLLTNK